MHIISSDRARYWLQRWDRQQEYYMPDREARFTIIGDVLNECVTAADPLIVDLGIGPGSLAARLIDRLPNARIVGVDADPLLLQLAQSAYGGARLRLVKADLRRPGWYDALGLDRAPDAYVSTTALHWMDRQPLQELITECGRTIAPGGVFVNADHLYEGQSGQRLDQLMRRLTAIRQQRVGDSAAEDWKQWWSAIEQDPELDDAVLERAGGFEHTVTDRPSIYDYLDFLRTAGFVEAGIAWQYADDRVIVGLTERTS